MNSIQDKQKPQEDPRYTERLGSGYVDWIRDNLVPFLSAAVRTFPRAYTRDELTSHAEYVVAEYVLDDSRGGKNLRGFVPKTNADVLRVRKYVARVARNEVLRAIRGEDNPTGVHTPNLGSLKSAPTRSAALRASAYAGVHSISFEDGDLGGTDALDMVSIDNVDPQFYSGSTTMDPAEICEMRESEASWSPAARDFVDALFEHLTRVKPSVDPEYPEAASDRPSPKVARRDRILLANNHVNSAYLLVKSLHEVDPAQALRLAPAMCLRWIYGRDTPAKVSALLGPLMAGRSLADVYEAEARSLISWARKYTKLTKYLREPEMRQVVSDARSAVERWRGAYASRGAGAKD